MPTVNFLYPSFLFALFAIAIPIIIHLFNFRRYKKVLFTNVRFLKEIKQQTRAKSQLKHLLVLASRILAVSFLVFAFAQPYIPVEKNLVVVKENLVSIYIDNSFSMDATNANGRLLEQAKSAAMEIASGFRVTDQYQLLTNNFAGRQRRLLNQEEFLEQVSNVKMSSHVRSLADVVQRQGEVFEGRADGGKRSFIISDFQRSNTQVDQIVSDSSVAYTLVPLSPQERANLYIDSCWFESPIRRFNQPDQLTVRVRNISDKEYDNIPLKLMINGVQKALGSCSVGPNRSVDVSLSFTVIEPGIINAVVSLTDYPVTFDDAFYFNYNIASSLKVLCISDSGYGDRLRSLYANDAYYEFDQVTFQNVDYSSIPEMDLIILENLESVPSGLGNALQQFREVGGSIAIFPGLEADLGNYETFLAEQLKVSTLKSLDTARDKVDKVNLDHYIFSDVFEKVPERMDLPVVYSHYHLTTSSTSVEALFTLQNGNTFLNVYDEGLGTVYLFTVPLLPQASNLPEHALFVPLMYKIAIHSLNSGKLFYTLGKNNKVEGPVVLGDGESESIYHLVSTDRNMQEFDIIPEIRIVDQSTQLLLHDMLSTAGNYRLQIGGIGKRGYAFNYDRLESDLICYNQEELKAQIEAASLSNFNTLASGGSGFSYQLSSLGEGTKMWKLCIIFALVFLAMETILLRFWK
ncbi:MAG: BatA and WFA domain-containing protein [Flavobacteriales bacterium]|nr:BatA and WFA domain-containing protein [Flavobacteriales bacterium]